MKDLKGFCKLFDITIPNVEHFDYYVNQLSKTNKFSNIYELLELYKDFEKDCDDVLEYKKTKLQEIVNYILETYAYQEFSCHPMSDYSTNKSFVYEDDKFYVSIDIIKANFTSFKEFDDKNEFGDSYAEFLSKFGMHEVFSHSKNFRQFVFGNVNPKRQSKVQRTIIEGVINSLTEFNLETVRSDEVIYSIDNFEGLKGIINVVDQSKFKVQVFKVKRIDDFRVNTFYSFDGEELKSELVGCDGNKYFMFLKQYILKEKLDIRDLYFKYSNGGIAIWNVDGLKVELND